MHFVKKKVKGKTYLSVGETHWVDGRAKTTILRYLGSAEKVYQIFLGWIKKKQNITADINLRRRWRYT